MPVVLGRYSGRAKNQARIYFDGDVLVPVLGEGRAMRQARYQVTSALIHIGNQPTSGHYRALLRSGDGWLSSDDAVPCARTGLSSEHACNAYLLWLVNIGSDPYWEPTDFWTLPCPAGDGWLYSDDAVPCARTGLSSEHACNAYLLWLVKRGM